MTIDIHSTLSAIQEGMSCMSDPRFEITSMVTCAVTMNQIECEAKNKGAVAVTNGHNSTRMGKIIDFSLCVYQLVCASDRRQLIYCNHRSIIATVRHISMVSLNIFHFYIRPDLYGQCPDISFRY